MSRGKREGGRETRRDGKEEKKIASLKILLQSIALCTLRVRKEKYESGTTRRERERR